MYFLYYTPATQIARGQGTVLSDNWYNALNWINENTAECAVIATYWDPGHFITGIGKRAVIFDGASQSNLFTRPYDYEQEGLVVNEYDANLHHIVLYKDGNKTTARIQDVSTTLLTANETLAVEILREYLKPGCDEMYYIASADLIYKSTWWTYFSTWNPVDKKGTPYVYSSIPLGSARPDIRQNAVIYTYPASDQQAFILYVTNESIALFLQQQGNAQPIKVEKFIIFDQNGNGQLITQSDAGIQGTAFIEPGNRALLFIAPELENALFTRMFLYDGNGLQRFEFVNSWGGEVKLYRVKFDEAGTSGSFSPL
jgi:dolichyl-diphosphooligosaccharide--protein glycosyltransferase